MADSTLLADSVLAPLLVGGLMGLLGQGARTVVGMKGMVDYAGATGLSQDDLFRASRLLFSLMLGFLVGMAAALTFGLDKLTSNNIQALLGIAAAGYAGVDFLEGFISKYLSGAAQTTGGKLAAPASLSVATKAITDQQAQEILFDVLKKRFPDAVLSPDQNLSQYDYDDPISLITLRDDIYDACKIYINAGAIIKCQKLSDVIKLITKPA